MGRLLDREPDLVEGAKQPIAGMPNGVGKRARVGTVAAIAVERDAVRLARKRDHGAGRRLHLCEAGARRAQPVGKRIVAAGVDQQQVDLHIGLLEVVENAGKADALRQYVGIISRIGIGGHQIIQPMGLDAMAGVIKQRDVGAGQLFPEFLQRGVEAGLVEVELGAAAHHEEAERQ
jgi:hypothetical protein